MPEPVKALVFDVYGTLLDTGSIVSVCEELFPGRGESLSNLWRAKQLEYTWLLSLMEHYEDFRRVTERSLTHATGALSLPAGPSERTRLMDGYLRLEPYPDVALGLQALSRYPKAVLSNGTREMLMPALEHAGLASTLSQVISVDETGVYKPSPKVYQLAVDSLGLERDSIGFVSSNAWDAAGARSFGFWTCWLNRSGGAMDELGFLPDATIETLRELAELL